MLPGPTANQRAGIIPEAHVMIVQAGQHNGGSRAPLR